MRSLDAYLERIGLADAPRAVPDEATLRAVHRAHMTAIPFENLDPLRGVPASLDLSDLEDKLVTRRRGGYCFEHNTLLAAALTELGYGVAPMLGRVGFRESDERARSHLVLRVVDRHDRVWHADVGFGAGERSGTLLEPIPLGPGGEYEQSGWRYRVEPHGDELVLMALSGEGEWTDMYSFVPEPVPDIDIETSNWFTSTHPSSFFTRSIVVAGHEGASRVLLSDRSQALTLLTVTPAGRRAQDVAPADVPRLLAERFGLAGWEMDAAGRPVPTGAPTGVSG
jgi:N-hydroxyarylamine O-acetyltransferase